MLLELLLAPAAHSIQSVRLLAAASVEPHREQVAPVHLAVEVLPAAVLEVREVPHQQAIQVAQAVELTELQAAAAAQTAWAPMDQPWAAMAVPELYHR